MSQDRDLAAVRAAYAKTILASVGANDARLEAAFASVPREDFLGPGPWQLFQGTGGYVPTPDADPARLYTNDLFAIDASQQLNNGQPSLHAYLLAGARIAEGEHVVHIGTGAGYYTAIMAHLAGPSGRVTGIEFDASVAARAKENLAKLPNVEIIIGDGARAAFDMADVIYVNAGATRPADPWLDRLKDGGRLILPLTTELGFSVPSDFTKMARRGAMFRVERQGDGYSAKWIAPVAIFPCAGNRDETSEKALSAALENGRFREITRLYRRDDIPEEDCWLRAPGWCLAYR